MAQESLHEKEQLETLEHAAAQTAQPEQRPERIAQEAHQVREERRAGLTWALPYFIGAALAGIGIVLVEWNPCLVSSERARLRKGAALHRGRARHRDRSRDRARRRALLDRAAAEPGLAL